MVYFYPLCSLSLALSLCVIILCRLQPRDSPCVWKSLISACIRPASHRVLLCLLYSSDVTLCNAFHYTLRNGNKSNQGVPYLTMLSLQKTQLFYTGAILMLEDQNRVPGNNHFLVVFEACPSSERSVDHPEWNCLKCLAERLESTNQNQSGYPIFRGKKADRAVKNLKKWAWNLSCVKANKYIKQRISEMGVNGWQNLISE